MQTFSMSCHCRKVDGEIFLDNLAQSLLVAKQSHPEALYVLKNRRFFGFERCRHFLHINSNDQVKP